MSGCALDSFVLKQRSHREYTKFRPRLVLSLEKPNVELRLYIHNIPLDKTTYLNSASGCRPSGTSSAVVYADLSCKASQVLTTSGNTHLPAYSAFVFGTGQGAELLCLLNFPA